MKLDSLPHWTLLSCSFFCIEGQAGRVWSKKGNDLGGLSEYNSWMNVDVDMGMDMDMHSRYRKDGTVLFTSSVASTVSLCHV